jgi:hypothetical protein
MGCLVRFGDRRIRMYGRQTGRTIPTLSPPTRSPAMPPFVGLRPLGDVDVEARRAPPGALRVLGYPLLPCPFPALAPARAEGDKP